VVNSQCYRADPIIVYPELFEQIVEPVFGIIKSVMGFRRFSMRDWKA
jgi:hypothetical protein